MSKKITFSTAKPQGNNTKLEQDENGYYNVILGGLNIFNEHGLFYMDEGVKALVKDDSTTFFRRLTRGYLKGEVNHPKWEPGMSKDQYMARCQLIDKDRVSHHIRELIFEETDIDVGGPNGKKVILIRGWVKPSGPRGDELKKDLDDPEINVPFSIRSFTVDDYSTKPITKVIKQLITFDWVDEPGIQRANKFSTLAGGSPLSSGNESFASMDIVLTSDDITTMIANANTIDSVGFESFDLTESLTELSKLNQTSSTLNIFRKW